MSKRAQCVQQSNRAKQYHKWVAQTVSSRAQRRAVSSRIKKSAPCLNHWIPMRWCHRTIKLGGLSRTAMRNNAHFQARDHPADRAECATFLNTAGHVPHGRTYKNASLDCCAPICYRQTSETSRTSKELATKAKTHAGPKPPALAPRVLMVQPVLSTPAGWIAEPRSIVHGRVKRRTAPDAAVKPLDLSTNEKIVQTFTMLGSIASSAAPFNPSGSGGMPAGRRRAGKRDPKLKKKR